MKTIHRKWTDEEKEYLKEITPGRSRKDIHLMMCDKFNNDYTFHQVVGAMKRYGLRNGIDTKLKKGGEAWNKGKKGYMGANKTSFKKGNRPFNYLPIGSELVNADGYIEIKVSDDGKRRENWKSKHRVIWEEHHGEVPDGHVVIFGDGDKRNFDIDNLILVKRAQLTKLNQYHMIQKHAELTKSAINVIDLMNEISKRKKELKKRGK